MNPKSNNPSSDSEYLEKLEFDPKLRKSAFNFFVTRPARRPPPHCRHFPLGTLVVWKAPARIQSGSQNSDRHCRDPLPGRFSGRRRGARHQKNRDENSRTLRHQENHFEFREFPLRDHGRIRSERTPRRRHPPPPRCRFGNQKRIAG
jgi:hypothetical protein